MHYEYMRNVHTATLQMWMLPEARISSSTHGRIADYEPVNLLMRQFKSRAIIDFALYSGSFIGILIAVYTFEGNSISKEKID